MSAPVQRPEAPTVVCSWCSAATGLVNVLASVKQPSGAYMERSIWQLPGDGDTWREQTVAGGGLRTRFACSNKCSTLILATRTILSESKGFDTTFEVLRDTLKPLLEGAAVRPAPEPESAP